MQFACTVFITNNHVPLFFYFLIDFLDIPNLKCTFVTAFFFTPICLYFLQTRNFFNFYWLFTYFSVKSFWIIQSLRLNLLLLSNLLILYALTWIFCLSVSWIFYFYLSLSTSSLPQLNPFTAALSAWSCNLYFPFTFLPLPVLSSFPVFNSFNLDSSPN